MKRLWTEAHLQELVNNGMIKSFSLEKKQQPKAKRTKHNNVKVETEDGVFDSKKEYKRYKELRLLLKKGEIGFLAKQVQFELNKGGSHSLIYIADFVYTTKEGKQVVEDVKGMRTTVYKKKKKLMKQIHKIEIKEI